MPCSIWNRWHHFSRLCCIFLVRSGDTELGKLCLTCFGRRNNVLCIIDETLFDAFFGLVSGLEGIGLWPTLQEKHSGKLVY